MSLIKFNFSIYDKSTTDVMFCDGGLEMDHRWRKIWPWQIHHIRKNYYFYIVQMIMWLYFYHVIMVFISQMISIQNMRYCAHSHCIYNVFYVINRILMGIFVLFLILILFLFSIVLIHKTRNCFIYTNLCRFRKVIPITIDMDQFKLTLMAILIHQHFLFLHQHYHQSHIPQPITW